MVAELIYVNPQMGTNSVWERGVPKWEFLTFPYGEGRKFPSFPSHCLNYFGPPVASNGLSRTHEIA
jgi:hypothetical protein